MPLALVDLDPEHAIQPPPERRRSGLLRTGLDPSFELGGRNVAALGAACASRVPPNAAEVPEAALGNRVVQLRAALGVELAARGHAGTGVDMRDGGAGRCPFPRDDRSLGV